VAGEARTVHVVQEATPRGQGNDRLGIGRRDVLARASWMAVLVSGWGLIAWGLLYLAAVDVATQWHSSSECCPTSAVRGHTGGLVGA
jgi:hypothetical protein